jgi:hypothetical protein
MAKGEPFTMTIKNPFGILASLVAAGALVLSCGDGGGDPREEFISTYCGLLQPCCAMAKLPSDGQQCRLVFAILRQTSYDANAGERCLTELRAASSKPDFCAGSKAGPAVCRAVFKQAGSKKPGESCDSNTDCAPSPEGDVQCQRQLVDGREVRKCQIQLVGKAGDQPCVGTVSGDITSLGAVTGDVAPRGYLCRTADGLYCNYDTSACTSLAAIGGACTRSDQCPDGALCDDTGKCGPPRPIGGMCRGPSFGRGGCVPGAFCQSTSMTCQAQLGHGMACADDEECTSSNCVTGKCEGDVPVDLGLGLFCGDAP